MEIYVGNIVRYIGNQVFTASHMLGIVMSIENRYGTQEKAVYVKFENGMQCYLWLKNLRLAEPLVPYIDIDLDFIPIKKIVKSKVMPLPLPG